MATSDGTFSTQSSPGSLLYLECWAGCWGAAATLQTSVGLAGFLREGHITTPQALEGLVVSATSHSTLLSQSKSSCGQQQTKVAETCPSRAVLMRWGWAHAAQGLQFASTCSSKRENRPLQCHVPRGAATAKVFMGT